MAVSLLDTGETPFLPPYLSKLPGGEWSAPPPFLLVLYTFKIQIRSLRSAILSCIIGQSFDLFLSGAMLQAAPV